MRVNPALEEPIEKSVDCPFKWNMVSSPDVIGEAFVGRQQGLFVGVHVPDVRVHLIEASAPQFDFLSEDPGSQAFD
jgi:hypothetical protein